MRNELRDAITNRLGEKQDAGEYYYGTLGSVTTGAVQVPGRPGYVYVTLGSGAITQAYNTRVPLTLNLPVVIGIDPIQADKAQLSVLSARALPRAGSTPENFINVSGHHASHEYFNVNGGQDVVYVQLRQIMPLRPTPLGGWNLYINPDLQIVNGTWQTVGGSIYYLGNRAVTTYTSGSAGDERMMLISLDLTSGSVVFTNGVLKAISTSTMADVPVTPPGNIPICAIRFWTGQTDIIESVTQTDLADLRMTNTANALAHNDLAGLQGGSATERYHLTAAQHAAVGNGYSGSAPINVSGSIIGHDASGVIAGTYNRLVVDVLGHVTSGSDVPGGGGTTYSGSAPINVSGSIISHNTSGVAAGTYNLLTVDGLGHITSGSVVADNDTIYSGSAPITVSGSTISHDTSGVIAGTYNRIVVDARGHVTSGSVVADSDTIYSGSAPITVSGSVISHNVSGVVSGVYNQLAVNTYGHITSGSMVADTEADDARWGYIQRYGFVDNTQTTIGYNDANFTFTLGVTSGSFTYMRSGSVCTISGSKAVALTSGSALATGSYYVYIDTNDGALISSTSPWTLLDTKVPVAIVTWNSALTPKYWLMDERHTSLIDRRMHYYAHTTEGTKYISGGVPSGYVVAGAGDLDSDNTYGISQTSIADEDLLHTLSALPDSSGSAAVYVSFYRSGSGAWGWVYSAMPYRYTNAGFIQWDNNGVMTQGIKEKAYNSYLLYTNLSGSAQYLMVNGRGEYTTTPLAQAENPGNFNWTGINISEFIIAYQFTWETKEGYAAKGKCRLAAAPRRLNIAFTQTAIGIPTLDHNSLSGLQGGTAGEYYHLTAAELETAKTVYSGSAPITVSGSVISLSASGVVDGTYNRITVDLLGRVTSGSDVAGTGTIYSGSAPITVSGSVISHNVSGVVAGTYNQLAVNTYGHITSGSVVASGGGTTYSGSAPITVSGSTISHAVSGASAGTYTQVTVDTLGHVTSGLGGTGAYMITATAGESLAVRDCVYVAFIDTDGYYDPATVPGRVYKTDADFNNSSRTSWIAGFASSSSGSGASLQVQIAGVVSGFSSMTSGAVYYVSQTPGLITGSPPTTANVKVAGIALSSTDLLIDSRGAGNIPARKTVSVYGYIGGGRSTSYRATVDIITFATGVTAGNVNALSQGRGLISSSGVSDCHVYGYIGGGYTGAAVVTTDRITYSNSTVAANAASNLTVANYTYFSVTDKTLYGYFSTSTTYSDRIVFSTGVTAANPGGYLSADIAWCGISDGALYGYGIDGTQADRIVFSTGVWAANAASRLSSNRTLVAGVSDNINYGYMTGGYTNITTADRIVFATGVTSANVVSNLTVGRSYPAGFSDGVNYGYVTSGYNVTTNFATTERINFANGVTALNAVSDLTLGRNAAAGLSDGAA